LSGLGSLLALFGDRSPINCCHLQSRVDGLFREIFSPQQRRTVEQIVPDLQRCTAKFSCNDG
jgi:hypothetical protein